jgi:hypothetical protein
VTLATELYGAPAPSASASIRARLAGSALRPLSAAVAGLGLINFPAFWFLQNFDEREWMPGASVCLGLIAAQVFVLALMLGCCQDHWKYRCLRVYGLALGLILTWTAGVFEATLRLPDIEAGNFASFAGLTAYLFIGMVVGAWFPVSLVRDEKHIQFVRFAQVKELPADAPRARWSLGDMLVGTALVAFVLGLLRLAPVQFESQSDLGEFVIGYLGATLGAGAFSLLSMVGVIIFHLHSRPHRALWRPVYTLPLLALVIILSIVTLSVPMNGVRFVLLSVTLIFLAYGLAITATFAFLELTGWKLEWHARD